MAPVDVVAFGGRIVRALRIIVRGDDASARYIEAIDEHEPAGRDDVGMDIERNGFLRVQRQFRDLVAPDISFAIGAVERFQAGSINDFLDGFDLALDFLGGQLELVSFAFGEWTFAEPKNARFETRKFKRRSGFMRGDGSARDKDLFGEGDADG